MQIDIPETEQQKLAHQALAAGFDDVETYVAQHVLALAHQGGVAFAPLGEEEMRESLAMCDQGMAEAEAGRGMSVDEALQATLQDLENSRR